MAHLLAAALLFLLPPLRAPQDAAQAAPPATGLWRAALASPGGDLPFGIELERDGNGLVAHLVNGPERIPVPRATLEHRTLVLDVEHYASKIVANLDEDGRGLQGLWIKRVGGGGSATMPFVAAAGDAPRFPSGAAPEVDVTGRWAVAFAGSDAPAVGVFEQAEDGSVTGTFLTTTGDYRYLAGNVDGRRLRLSCFDGAHAFLFDATVDGGGELAGDFWSRDAWHETWTGRRDDGARLPDAWTRPGDELPLALLQFPVAANAPDGRQLVSLADPAFAGKALVIEVFGSWCPNCHDLGRALTSLSKEVDAADVAFVGIGFELSGDAERDVAQLVRYAERHGLDFPILYGGTADKAYASEALPGLPRVAAYPTTVFVGRDGRVRAVHSGFSGPGTGAAHEELLRDLRKAIEALAAEPAPDLAADVEAIVRGPWRDPSEGSFTTFEATGAASGTYVAEAIFSFFAPPSDGPLHVGSWLLAPTALHTWPTRSDESAEPDRGAPRTAWHPDRRAGVYLDPANVGRRLIPGARPILPVVGLSGPDRVEDMQARLEDPDPLWRREALHALARLVVERRQPNPFLEEGEEPPPVPDLDPTPLLADDDAWVRCTAAWAIGECGVEEAADELVALLESGHAALRREAVRALGRLAAGRDERARIEAMRRDPHPLVREAAAAAIAAFDAPPEPPAQHGGPPGGWDDDGER